MKKCTLIFLVATIFCYFCACSKDGAPFEDEDVNHNDNMETTQIYITVGSEKLICILENNSSSKALAELLKQGPQSVRMNDYANMEKVGELPVALPQNNRQIHTAPGDVILYQGRYFVIYYGNNNYSLTKLGVISGDYSGSELKKILGNGDVTVTLSLQ